MVEIDFLPDRVIQERARRRRMVRRAYLLVFTVGVLAACGSVRQGWIRQARAESSLLADIKNNNAAMLLRKASLDAEWNSLQLAKRIGERLGGHVKPMEVLAAIETVVRNADKSSHLVLKHVSIGPGEGGSSSASPRTPAGAPLPPGLASPAPAAPARVSVLIVGVSVDDVTVANFIAQLSAYWMFEDVNMEYTKTVNFNGTPNAREFKVTCRVAR
ncbi:MAG: hypothetical protein NTV86_21340 [Planctomycetota bacterium]|nr:hypothetical protein [Planctomycetota bacterium]